MPNYETKKELDHATCVDTSDLFSEEDFVALKADADKIDIIKLVNIQSSFNNLKAKVNYSDRTL